MRAFVFMTVLSGVLLLGAGAVHAKDLCVYLDNGATLLTVRGIRIPKPGSCRPVVGTAGNSVMHGTVCRTTLGNVLRLGVSVEEQPALFFSGGVRQIAVGLDYPFAEASGMQYSVEDIGPGGLVQGIGSLNDMTAAYCAGSDIL